MGNRYKLDDVDEFVAKMVKDSITNGVRELKKRGLNNATIEILLVKHVRKELKEFDESKK